MKKRFACALCGFVIGVGALATGQSPRFTAPRTPWGDPDLQGVWSGVEMSEVPLQRPPQFGTRSTLTEEEFLARVAEVEKQRAADETGPSDPGTPSPPHWLERGKPSRQSSLIVDPADGRQPPLTDEARKRNAALQEARRGRGPADSWEDRGIYDRCISRGVAGSAQAGNGIEIVQAPGYVAIRIEMIHETRVIPLDGRPHVGSEIQTYIGDQRGRWDGSALVVDTTNLNGRTNIAGNGGGRTSEQTRLTERFWLSDAYTLQYEITIDDPATWTRPWTVSLPRKRDPSYRLFEYACHEGNYALRNMLSAARADERGKGR